jgi:hypothetical protein
MYDMAISSLTCSPIAWPKITLRFSLTKKHLSFDLNFVVNYFSDGRFTSVQYSFDTSRQCIGTGIIY